ncbi:MAG: VanZ family protein [Bacillota bacterium]|nr:VanZ family protein [Bacillota bacterium]
MAASEICPPIKGMIREFKEQITILCLLLVPIWAFLRWRIICKRKREGREVYILKEVVVNFFALYLIILAGFTIVPIHLVTMDIVRPSLDKINFIPIVNTVRDMFNWPQGMGNYMIKFWIANVLGNVLLFVPMGMLLPLFSDKFKKGSRTIFISFMLSLSIEIIQFLSLYIGSIRSCDIDDIILNTLGGASGFIIYSFVEKLVRAKTASKFVN